MLDFEKYDFEKLIDIAKKQEAIFYNFLNLIDDAILLVNKNFVVEFLNEKAKELFDIKNEGDIPLKHFFNDFELEQKKEAISKALNLKKVLDVDNLTIIKGREIWVKNLFIPVDDLESDDIKILLFIKDITFRKYVEDQNIKVNERFAKIFQNNPAVVLISRVEDGKIIEINSSVEKVFGYTQSEILGQSTKILYADPRERALFIDKILTKGPITNYELKFKRKDGSIGWASVSADFIEIDEENCIIAIINDISEKKFSSLLNEALYKISNIIYSSKNLDDLFAKLHEEIKNIIYSENFYIAIYNRETNIISFPYFVDQKDNHAPSKKFGNGLTEYVLKTKEAKLLTRQDIINLSRKQEAEIVGTLSEYWLGVPLLGDNFSGVLAVQSYDENTKYSEKDKDFLSFVGQQISRLIDKKILEEKTNSQLKRYYSILEALPTPLFATDNNFKIFFYNDKFLNSIMKHKNVGPEIKITDIIPDFYSSEIHFLLKDETFTNKTFSFEFFEAKTLQISRIEDGFLFIFI
uniref:PAS domain S-box protein n=1 Tax=candidate division WOR-3 bacterium TaxID=2052148 RepID=A0A7C3NER7_UNCW3